MLLQSILSKPSAMRFITFIAFLISVCCPKLLKAQVIKWDENRPLKWSDFKGRLGFGWSASTYTQINYTYKVLILIVII